MVADEVLVNQLRGADLDLVREIEVLKYMLERYANIQGTNFVKRLKGNNKGDVDMLVASQATRTHVVHRLVQSKAAREVKKKDESNEKQFWKDVADNVLKEHDKGIQNNSNVSSI